MQRILVTLSTGKQGSSVVQALAKRNVAEPYPYEILAVTRTASSSKASALSALPGVIILESVYDPALIFAKAAKCGSQGPLHGVFSVQQSIDNTDGGLDKEVSQGIRMIDEAAKAGVEHFVYSSVDMGGLANTEVPHFESKRRIEQHLESAGLPHTILRPTSFMENITFGTSFLDRLINTGMVASLHQPMQLIACSDIGEYAALIFDHPQEYVGKELSLAGDLLNGKDMEIIFRKACGRDLAVTFSLLGSAGIQMQKELRSMFRFFNKHGYTADIPLCKKLHPGVLTFEEWVRTKS